MKQLIYDLPTRLFHWLFAALFLTAFIITKTVDNESPTFAYHMLAGLTLSFIVIMRLIWGAVGTKHAKLADFALNPTDLVNYFKGILAGKKTRWSGHNPASSWAAIIMMLLALALGITGFLMTTGRKESLEDIHELLANTFIIVVILHVAGIVIHTIRHKEMIGLSMVTGQKENFSANEEISSAKNSVGILFLVLVAAFVIYLRKNYNPQTQTLTFFGNTLQLGESEDDGED